MLWGTVPILVDDAELQQPQVLARRLPRELGLAEEGQAVLMVTGFRDAEGESEPTVTVLRV
jgi:hypothetical protein